MVVVHKDPISKTGIQNAYHELMGDWSHELIPLLTSDYMSNLAHFIEESYKGVSSIYPEKKDIYKAFRKTSFKEVKVVMLGTSPYASKMSNGLAFGNKDITGTSATPLLNNLENCVNRTVYENRQNYFDVTLEDWARQGVLLLNTTLTTSGIKDDHEIYWRNFTRTVIEVISSKKNNIVFMFMHPGNEVFEKYIALSKHYILKCNNYYIPENNDIFVKCNEILINKLGVDSEIVW